MNTITCRCCGSRTENILDLGIQPPSNAYISTKACDLMHEEKFPLGMVGCKHCGMLQTSYDVSPNLLFNPKYQYFSSISNSWLDHVEKTVGLLETRFNPKFVIEIASNDGYMLDFWEKINILAVGVEPTMAPREISLSKGHKVIGEFFSEDVVQQIHADYGIPDLVICNNVFAHVPDIESFAKNIINLISDDGTIIIEAPYAENLVKEMQFDTIYHEHYSYLTITSVSNIFNKVGGMLYDFDFIQTHGGSIRYFVSKNIQEKSHGLLNQLKYESKNGISDISYFYSLSEKLSLLKSEIIDLFNSFKKKDLLVAGYGAAAKGNTILNYVGLNNTNIKLIADNNPAKIGMLTPGSHIPIVGIDELKELRPDVVIIFPWNIQTELVNSIRANFDYEPDMIVLVPEIKYL